jgi:hypothetical protein
MPNQRAQPTVRRRRLSQALRQHRTDAGLERLDDAVEVLVRHDKETGRRRAWDKHRLSRMETGKANTSPDEVGDVLTAYGVSDVEVIESLKELAAQANQTGWWQPYSRRGLLDPSYTDYISLENDAAEIDEWAPLLIPGLLQTAGYAREVITANTSGRTDDEINGLVEVRMARQAILTRPGSPPALRAIIHEAVLHQGFAAKTMRDQLRRLLERAELPNVNVCIMPLRAKPHPGNAGGFSLLNFRRPLPPVVLLENLMRSSYVGEADDVNRYSGGYERIIEAALPPTDSLALIEHTIEEGSRT